MFASNNSLDKLFHKKLSLKLKSYSLKKDFSERLSEVESGINFNSTISFFYATPYVTIATNATVTVCNGTTSGQLPYTDASINANKFTLIYGAPAKTQGFNDIPIPGQSFPGGSAGNFPIVIPPNAAPGTYDVTLYVHNTNSEKSNPYYFKIVIKGNSTIDNPSNKIQEVCINTSIANINFSIGGSGTGANLTGNLPPGVTGSYSGSTYKISGTPTTSGTFNYTVTTTGDCTQQSQSGTFTVKPDPTISSPANKDQELCINTAISPIQFNTTSPATGANVTGLPTGLSATYSNNKFTITGTPTVAGIFDYTVTTTGTCVQKSQTGKIIVKPDPTISVPTNKDQELCINTAISSIQFNTTSPATGATVTGLPAGLSGTYSNDKFTITGTPTVSGTFDYTVTTTGTCVQKSQTGKIIVKPDPTLSVPFNKDQELCINTALSNIQFNITASATGASITGLPAGLAGTYSNDKFTITGTPTVSGIFDYTVTTTGSCVQKSQTGRLIVKPDPTLSVPINKDQELCINIAISPIQFITTSPATGATITGLPTGMSGTYSNGKFTITGTPTVSGTFDYTVTTTGTCVQKSQTGKIIVKPDPTISAPTNKDQELCINTDLSNIQFNITAPATGASITGLPTGTSGTYSNGKFTITGTPTVSGTFNYIVTTSGTCVQTEQSGTLIIKPDPTISDPGNKNQIICYGSTLEPIQFSITSPATGATVSGLPSGLTGSYSAGKFTISGNPTSSGTFNYTVKVTGSCALPTQTGIITVYATPEVDTVEDVIGCNDFDIDQIIFTGNIPDPSGYFEWTNDNVSIGLPASGNGNIPAFTATNPGSTSVIAKITVTPISYGCPGNSKTFEIKVNPTINVDYEISPVSCNGAGDGKIEITNTSGGNANYRYSLDGTNFVTSTNFKNLAGGTYTLYVKDTEVCETSYEFTIDEPEELAVTAPTSTSESCYGGVNNVHDGAITAGVPTGGNGGYSYSLDNTNFQSSPNFTNLETGDYTIFIKDKNGCATQSNINVGSLAQMKAELSKIDIKCYADSTGVIKINNPSGGSGNYQYQLIANSNSKLITDWTNSVEFTGLWSDNYTINMRDASNSNCIISLDSSYLLSQPDEALSATITSTRTTNYGSPTGTATANATGGSGGYTYEWRADGQIAVLQTTKTASSLSAGDYVVTITDSNGCSTTAKTTIIDIVQADISETSRCLENTDKIRTSSFQVLPETTVGGSGDPYYYKYEWNFGAGVKSVNQPSPYTGLERFEVEYSSKGDKTITLTITDGDGVVSTQTFDHYVGGCFEGCVGQNQSNDFKIDKNDYFIGDINGDRVTNANCSTAGDKYLWINITKSSNVYVLDVELIYSTSSISILGVNPTTDSGQLTGCFGTKVTNGNNGKYEWQLIPVGKYKLFKVAADADRSSEIEWECGESFAIDQIRIRWTTNSNKECGDATGNSCIDSKDVVPVSVPILANYSAKDTPCNGTSLGSVTINAYGGVKPFQYSKNGDVFEEYVSTKEFYNLPAGDYENFWVKDSKGETFHLPTITIAEPEVLEFEKDIEFTPILCYGGSTSATATVKGGTEPYEYLWNDSEAQTSATATNLFKGTYTVTVTDANGCQAIETVSIDEPVELTQAEAGESQTLKCGFISTTLNANEADESKEIGTWTIDTNNSATGGEIKELHNSKSTFTGESGKSYTLIWTIANPDGNCETSSSTTITFNTDCSHLDFDGIDDYIYFGDNHNFSSGSFTIEAWVKPGDLSGTRTVLSKRNSKDLAAGGFDLIVNSGSPTFRWGSNSITTTSKFTSPTRWYHLAVTYNGSEYKLYVDGIRMATKSGSNPASTTNPFLIGAMYQTETPNNPINYFEGWIEEVRLWGTNLSEEQLHFIMNQRLAVGSSPVQGAIIPLDIPNNSDNNSSLNWSDLKGYYQLISAQVNDGISVDLSNSGINGDLRNIETDQKNTAPLPYISAENNKGAWSDPNSWTHPEVWHYPNANGINGAPIEWNIATISHDMVSDNRDITLLGLLSTSNVLDMEGVTDISKGSGSGNALTITHYLDLNGTIDLNGESQLVQSENSQVFGTGNIERDQQGTASSYNYNYWSSPVLPNSNSTNYKVKEILFDGSAVGTNKYKSISFSRPHNYADGAKSDPIKISDYWINTFRAKKANDYSQWEQIGSNTSIKPGEGYTMKGTQDIDVKEGKLQNYTYNGFPNNGDITLTVGKDQNYLIGNPYPSAIDGYQFIKDNIAVNGGKNTKNVFNGVIYFWDHFSGKTHYLSGYIGGYATLSLAGGVPAISNDVRTSNNNARGSKTPSQYIPVAQGFFINTNLDTDISQAVGVTVDGGNIIFNNGQRVFAKESGQDSQFLSQEKPRSKGQTKESDTRPKIRLNFKSPLGYHRQILATADENTTNGYDIGYDAPINDDSPEDMFWLIQDYQFVIQGVPNFNKDQVLPLGIKVKEKGEITIKIDALEHFSNNATIYIKDLENNTYHDLRASNYTLQVEGGMHLKKFAIVFQKEKETESEGESGDSDTDTGTDENTDSDEGTSTGTDENTDANENEQGETPTDKPIEVLPLANFEVLYSQDENVIKILNPAEMMIEKVELYNMLGQRLQLYNSMSYDKTISFPLQDYPKATYVVKVKSVRGTASKTILLKR